MAKEMGMFSHWVWFEIGGSKRKLYKIFPRKGEVWAVEEYGWVEVIMSFGDVDDDKEEKVEYATKPGKGGGNGDALYGENVEAAMASVGSFISGEEPEKILARSEKTFD